MAQKEALNPPYATSVSETTETITNCDCNCRNVPIIHVALKVHCVVLRKDISISSEKDLH